VAVRRATYLDIPQLRRLFAALVAELEAARPVPYPIHAPADLDAFTVLTARRLEVDPTYFCYVAVDDATGTPVGFLGGELCERALGAPHRFCAAHWLYVEPAARAQGHGRALVRLGCEDLAALGVTHIEVGALAGDLQWAQRGWQPYLVHHVLPLAAVIAGAAERPPAPPEPLTAVSPEAPIVSSDAPIVSSDAPIVSPEVPTVPPAKPRRRHRRTRPLPAPEAELVKGTGT
jgi:GNAT superfamily N-acetyltransferase